MPWQFLKQGDLKERKALIYENLMCPYFLCPSNQPYLQAKKARMKFVQKISPMIHQYKCRDCGCLTNFSMEYDYGMNIKNSTAFQNPSIWGVGDPSYELKKPSFKFDYV